MRILNRIIRVLFKIKNYRRVRRKKKIYKRLYPDYRDYIRGNCDFKNKYAGKRCFILGNGPSLSKVDFSSLADEITFTVNFLTRNPRFKELKTNFHVWTDQRIFDDGGDDSELEIIETMKNINTDDNKPTCFYKLGFKDIIEEHKLDEVLDVHYLCLMFMAGNNMSKRKMVQMDEIMPDFWTIIQVIITMAVYMGFKEIYLLGCDSSSFINSAKVIMKECETLEYCYEIPEEERQRLEDRGERMSIRGELQHWLDIFNKYEQLYDYCEKHGVELYNATEGSLIDSLPRVRLQDILKS